MGLDMYANITAEPINKSFGFTVTTSAELHYWRKHPNLHGWMEALYREKGGSEDFNCVTLALSIDDLKRLEDDILHRRLPTTEGFFFGTSDGSEIDDDLAFITKAIKATACGYTVYYESWW